MCGGCGGVRRVGGCGGVGGMVGGVGVGWVLVVCGGVVVCCGVRGP